MAMMRCAGRHWAACVLLAAVAGSVLVWQESEAALVGAVDNSGNSWSSARVAIGTDLQLPMFATDNMAPGHPIARCVRITYTGNVRAAVRMYATPGSYTGNIADYLDLTVEEGDGGSNGSCNGFNPSTVYHDILSDFINRRTDFTSGVGAFSPGGPTSITYRLTATVRDDPAGQDRTGGVSFTWEAQNT